MKRIISFICAGACVCTYFFVDAKEYRKRKHVNTDAITCPIDEECEKKYEEQIAGCYPEVQEVQPVPGPWTTKIKKGKKASEKLDMVQRKLKKKEDKRLAQEAKLARAEVLEKKRQELLAQREEIQLDRQMKALERAQEKQKNMVILQQTRIEKKRQELLAQQEEIHLTRQMRLLEREQTLLLKQREEEEQQLAFQGAHKRYVEKRIAQVKDEKKQKKLDQEQKIAAWQAKELGKMSKRYSPKEKALFLSHNRVKKGSVVAQNQVPKPRPETVFDRMRRSTTNTPQQVKKPCVVQKTYEPETIKVAAAPKLASQGVAIYKGRRSGSTKDSKDLLKNKDALQSDSVRMKALTMLKEIIDQQKIQTNELVGAIKELAQN